MAAVTFHLFVRWNSTGDSQFYTITAADKVAALLKFLYKRVENIDLMFDPDLRTWTPKVDEDLGEFDTEHEYSTAEDVEQTQWALDAITERYENSGGKGDQDLDRYRLEPLEELPPYLQWYLLSSLLTHCFDIDCWYMQNTNESEVFA